MQPFGQSREVLADFLRAHDVTPTHQRVEIAHVLFERPRHQSAEQVFLAVNARQSGTSKATVYNTLRLFVDRGLVRELFVDRARVYYDPTMHPHHHFFDVDSGELIDIEADDMRVTGMPPLPEGVVAEGVDIVIRTRRTR